MRIFFLGSVIDLEDFTEGLERVYTDIVNKGNELGVTCIITFLFSVHGFVDFGDLNDSTSFLCLEQDLKINKRISPNDDKARGGSACKGFEQYI